MRLLAVASLFVVALAGCIGNAEEPLAPDNLPPAATLPAGLTVHQAGEVVALDPAAVLGSAPDVVGKLIGANGAEPNIGVTSSGAIFVSAFDFVFRSRDLGDTWELVHEFGDIHPPAPLPRDPIFNTDPMLWVDKDTDRVFNPVMWPVLVCSSGAYSDDEGDTWSGTPIACGLPPPMDHQKYATGRYAPGGPLSATPLYPNAVYYCYNQLIATTCATSLDGGLTFPINRMAIQGNCAGINGHMTTRDSDGALFIPHGFNCGQAAVTVSYDNGLTFTTRTLDVGGLGNEELDPEVAITPNGATYYFFRANADHRMYVARSHDDFQSVDGVFLVSPPDVTSTRFAGMVAGDDGKLAFAYLGTRDTAERAGNAPDETRWHLFVTMTHDAEADAPTFVTTQVTPEDDPVQVGYMWEGGGGDPGRNLLDFIDMVVDKEGRIYVAYADGCVDECAAKGMDATPDDSRARAAALAVLENGPMLFSEVQADWGAR